MDYCVHLPPVRVAQVCEGRTQGNGLPERNGKLIARDERFLGRGSRRAFPGGGDPIPAQ